VEVSVDLDIDCLDRDALLDLLLGKASEIEAASWEQHLVCCARCSALADTLRPEDDLTAAIRRPPPLLYVAHDADISAHMERLRHLRGPSIYLEVVETTSSTNGPSPAQENAQHIDRAGSYEILGMLGCGGTGTVYLARQARPKRLVALKMLDAQGKSNPARFARFQSEAEVIARLQHPNIVQIFEVGQHEGRPYFSMEYLDGGNLAEWLGSHSLAAHDAVRLIATLARAVHFAHERGIVHRDLKPANILMSGPWGKRSGESERGQGNRLTALNERALLNPSGPPLNTAKITDFGLAKFFGEQAERLAESPATETGVIVGTPSYMAPEQASGQSKEIRPAADVYALGAILYETLTGRPPFRAPSVLQTLEQVRSQEPVAPRRLQPRLSRDLETVCLKCLEKDPARRYPSARALADDLARFLRGEPIHARPASPWERARKWARRKPALAVLLAVSGLFIVAMLATTARLQMALVETRKQRARADGNYREARDAIQGMITRLERKDLAGVPRLMELRQDLLQDALTFNEGVLRQLDDPDPTVRFDAASAHALTGKIQILLGKRESAEANLLEATALLEKLTVEHPEAAEYQGQLGDCYSALGSFYGAAGARNEQYYQQALDVLQPLVEAHPEEIRWQQWLATAHHNLGVTYQYSGRMALAEQHYRDAITIRAQLIHDDPRTAQCRASLAEDYVNLGSIYMQTSRPDQADQVYRDAEALLKPLLLEHPEVQEYALALVAGYINWSYLLRETGRSAAALGILDDAVRLSEERLRQEPHYTDLRQKALEAHGARATLQESRQRYGEAVKDWDRLLELAPGPDVSVTRGMRALSLARAGDHVRASTEAKALAEQPGLSNEFLFHLACTYTSCIRAVGSDPRVQTSERGPLAERYASGAIRLLQRLRLAALSENNEWLKVLDSDRELQPLRARADFQELLRKMRERPMDKR
jgi:serine/threonine protein kinase/tetratricopeptide (TPR) repeat protein